MSTRTFPMRGLDCPLDSTHSCVCQPESSYPGSLTGWSGSWLGDVPGMSLHTDWKGGDIVETTGFRSRRKPIKHLHTLRMKFLLPLSPCPLLSLHILSCPIFFFPTLSFTPFSCPLLKSKLKADNRTVR